LFSAVVGIPIPPRPVRPALPSTSIAAADGITTAAGCISAHPPAAPGLPAASSTAAALPEPVTVSLSFAILALPSLVTPAFPAFASPEVNAFPGPDSPPHVRASGAISDWLVPPALAPFNARLSR
jgi:hypothetical protein